MIPTIALLLCLALSRPIIGATSVPDYLQEISVTINAGNASGSGVIFSRKDKEGAMVNFVWTAGHVVDGLRTEREIVSPDGSKRTVVEFADVRVAKELREASRTVGRLEFDAEVIKFSDSENGEDLALLRIRKTNFIQDSARFYAEKQPPLIGTELYHVGSLLGEMGANSMTTGIVSQQGRLIGKHVFDQTTVAAFPGSSGGGVFLRDGTYVAMLVRGAGETFNLVVPARRIREYAKKMGVEWTLDPSLPMPSEDELRLMPIEGVKAPEKKDGNYPISTCRGETAPMSPIDGGAP